MKLQDVRAAYDSFSAKASEIVRTLALAGIAVVWLFKTDGINGIVAIPVDLWNAAVLIVIALGLDLLHYVSGTISWAIFNKIKENAKIKESTVFEAPGAMNLATNIFFWSKIIAIVIGYLLILRYLMYRITPA